LTETSGNHGKESMHRAVQLREQRHKRASDRAIWQNLSMIGALGWLIVVPTLLGVLLGRWLDETFATGILFSGALIFVGVAMGGYLAWQRIKKEEDPWK
jgi:ATP synthase protein I